MKNNQAVPFIRTSLALLLLASILNLIASPVSFATRAANNEAAPFDGPTEFIRRIPLTTNDLVFSASTGKLYASVPSSAGSNGNSITTIDPATGVVNGSTLVGSEPNKLSLSDDGHSLYVSLDGAAAIRRFDVLTNTPGLQFSVGHDPFFGRYSVSDFAVAPGDPNLLAVARSQSGGVVAFDNGVARTGAVIGSDSLTFSSSASKLYGAGQFSTVSRLWQSMGQGSRSAPRAPSVPLDASSSMVVEFSIRRARS